MVRTIVLFYEQKVELHVPTYLTTKLIFFHEIYVCIKPRAFLNADITGK